jgi:hypothetical protein
MPEQREEYEGLYGRDDPYFDEGMGYGVGDRERRENGTYYNETETGNTRLEGVSDSDEQLANVPIVGWLTGADARYQGAQAEQRRRANEHAIRNLMEGVASADEAYTESTSDEYGDLRGGPSAFAGGDDATSAMYQLYRDGGYTSADRAQRRLASMERGQQLRGANEAALQQMQARGIGGGGAEMAARLTASQSMNQGQAMSDAATQIAAMNRGMTALQGAQQGEFARRSAIDSYNNRTMDWRRGREQRTTDTRNQARQQEHENRERGVALLTNQYGGADASRRADQQRQDEANESLTGAIAELVDL